MTRPLAGAHRIPHLLSIAGTDPSGGAGIQADLKSFSALGAYGMAVITAVVAQNTKGVAAVHPIPADFVTTQLENLFDDVRVDAVKIGMLGTAPVIAAVADVLERHAVTHVVLDPVMVAKNGGRLLDKDAVDTLRERLLPLVDVVTPNLPEGAVLLGDGEPQAQDLARQEAQAERLLRFGSRHVLLKGGHLPGDRSVDILVGAEGHHTLEAARVETTNDHGTGCTLSAAMAALRPQSTSWLEAVEGAKAYLTKALQAADQLHVGHGHGPVHHFHAWWPKT